MSLTDLQKFYFLVYLYTNSGGTVAAENMHCMALLIAAFSCR